LFTFAPGAVDRLGPLPAPEREAVAGGAGHKRKRHNLIAAHWRGDFSLGVAYWVIRRKRVDIGAVLAAGS
jgi:hypothetical protein